MSTYILPIGGGGLRPLKKLSYFTIVIIEFFENYYSIREYSDTITESESY